MIGKDNYADRLLLKRTILYNGKVWQVLKIKIPPGIYPDGIKAA